LNVVPAFSVSTTPPLAIVPLATGPAAREAPREIHVSVTNGTKGPADAEVRLSAPAGWRIAPASAPPHFTHQDETPSARFVVTAPVAAKTGAYAVKAVVTSPGDSRRFSEGYAEIDYPHIQRRQVIKPADTTFKVVDVRTTSDVKVGYIVGVGDQVPPALE